MFVHYRKTILKFLPAIIGLYFISLSSVSASYLERSDVQEFIQQMVKQHGFNRNQLQGWFRDVEKRQSIINAMMRPAEAKPWKEYRPIFITDKRITKGVEFWRKNKSLLQRAEREYGVPAEIIVAIIGVETFYGRQSGRFPVIDALMTLGFDYPPRAAFFRKELEQYLLLCRDENLHLRKTLGSYAGAMGMGQFISSSYRMYAVDFDGDGKRDLWNSQADAIGSVANYFKRHGWQKSGNIAAQLDTHGKNYLVEGRMMKPDTDLAEFRQQGLRIPVNLKTMDNKAVLVKLEGKKGNEYWIGLHNFYVITRYNHSPLYAMAVYQLSQEVASRVNNNGS